MAQAQTPIQRHMNNALSEMMSFSPYFDFYCIFFINSHKKYGITRIPLQISMLALF